MTDQPTSTPQEASAEPPSPEAEEKPKWRPLSARERRVFGVLVEKAKTTPDAYPLSLNALTNGCNQKSNRSPSMNLSQEEVEDILESLRAEGAVAEVQGGSRVAKFRHYMYDWLNLQKLEVAVITELLLRGEQTLGDLRARASRMENIPGQSELKEVVESLKEKNLLVELTPEGRGQIVTHNLYKPRELEELQARFAGGAPVERPSSGGGSRTPKVSADDLAAVQSDVAELKSEIAQLKAVIAELSAKLE